MNDLRKKLQQAIEETQDWGYDETNINEGINDILDAVIAALPEVTWSTDPYTSGRNDMCIEIRDQVLQVAKETSDA